MNVREGSKRLDNALLSEALTSKESVSVIVRNHLLNSSSVDADQKSDTQDVVLGEKSLDATVGYWSSMVWNFLEELRSSSHKNTSKPGTSPGHSGSVREWNLKDESDRYRVLYREGPEGTPFHTLCIDGLVDGDIPSGLCVAWESPMFKEWWPQFLVPTFKIVESKWLHRIRTGEDLSLIRFKVPWPLAQREILMSAFEMEYFQDELILGLINSVPEGVEISKTIHGYSVADLPAPSSDVRIEIAGGFVMQRISKDKFFFRTIMNMDMKLDFVPPWVINFISRQLAGQGLKLYQKAVSAVINGTGNGKLFQKLLKTGPLYERVRSGLEMKSANKGQPSQFPMGRLPTSKDSVKSKSLQGSIRRMGNSDNNRVVPYPVKVSEAAEIGLDESGEPVQPQLGLTPLIEEVKPEEEITPSSNISGCSNQGQSSEIKALNIDGERREYEDPEVEWAINILNKMIKFTHSCVLESGAASTHEVKLIPGKGSTDKLRTVPGTASTDTMTRTKVQGSELDLKKLDADSYVREPGTPSRSNTLYSEPDLKNSSDQFFVSETGTAATDNLKKSNIHNSESDLKTSDVENLGRASLLSNGLFSHPEETVNLSVPNVTQNHKKPEQSSTSSQLLPESCGTSGVLSANEIEIVSRKDEADTRRPGISGSGSRSLADHLQINLFPEEKKRKSKKWRWTCFSPSSSKNKGKRKTNLFGDDTLETGDFASSSRRNGRVPGGASIRYTNERGYVTDVDEVIVSQNLGELIDKENLTYERQLYSPKR